MSLTIYGIPASRAVRPLWAATELGLDFNHVNLNYQGGGTRTPDYYPGGAAVQRLLDRERALLIE